MHITKTSTILGLLTVLALASGCNKKEVPAPTATQAQSPLQVVATAAHQAEVQPKAALETQTADAANAIETEKRAGETAQAAEVKKRAAVEKAAGLAKRAEAEKLAATTSPTESSKATDQPAVPTPAVLSREEVASGLKEALAKGVENAVASLGREDGFLKNLNVKIPMPESLSKIELTLRTLRQDKLADDFITTLNRAAEKSAPEAAAVLGDSISQMTVTDAKAILTGTNNAATMYFRRTSETNLYARFLPIVKQATSETGVTSAYKLMVAKASFAGSFLGEVDGDIDAYVTRKALDGLFVKIAEEEQRIRDNPVARTTDLLQKVFGAFQKR